MFIKYSKSKTLQSVLKPALRKAFRVHSAGKGRATNNPATRTSWQLHEIRSRISADEQQVRAHHWVLGTSALQRGTHGRAADTIKDRTRQALTLNYAKMRLWKKLKFIV